MQTTIKKSKEETQKKKNKIPIGSVRNNKINYPKDYQVMDVPLHKLELKKELSEWKDLKSADW